MRSRLVILLASGTLLGASATAQAQSPLDALFGQQWSMQSDTLDAQTAWGYTDGTGSVVAVLDSGADMGHPDLQGALWTNPGEIPGNGIDDDGDGIVDDVHGADLVNGDGDPSDDDGHGTHVAGIIAAQRNAVGVAGLAPGAKIMVVKVLDAARGGNTLTVAQGIRYAIAHGANVINTSVNGDGDDPDLDSAIDAADAAGVTIVASAGNSGRNLDSAPSWPASDPAPNVVAVAATDQNGALGSFSNYGAGSVDIAAPGVAIPSTARGGGYELRTGTSMAAPVVAATLALLHAAAPQASAQQLRDVLASSADRTDLLAGRVQTGEVDPVAALAALTGRAPRSAAPAAATTAGAPAAPVAVAAQGKRRAKSGTKALVTWSVGGDSKRVASFRVSGVGGKTLATRSGASRGVWVKGRSTKLRVTARDASGKPLAAATLTLKQLKRR